MKKYTGWWFWILSPTFKLAEINKKAQLAKDDGIARLTKGIGRYNRFYFLTSLILAIVYGIVLGANRHHLPGFADFRILSAFIFGYLIVSRAVEIFAAFLIDAVEKLNGRPSTSALKFGDRLHLALKSYLEIMVGFGLLYYLLPDKFFSHPFGSIIEATYFSAVTMTTVGYGDFSPCHWISQTLVVLQVFCGLTLALVCFTIYTTLALADLTNKE
jgi:voltage-gated potassium channel